MINNADYQAAMERVTANLDREDPAPADAPAVVQAELDRRRAWPLPGRLARIPEIVEGFRFRDCVAFYREQPEEIPPEGRTSLVYVGSTANNTGQNLNFLPFRIPQENCACGVGVHDAGNHAE